MTDLHTIEATVAQGNLEPFYLFVGNERFLMERAVQAIRREALKGGVEGFNEEILDGKGLEAGQALGIAHTLPMMAERRFVWIRNAEQMATAELNALAPYLDSPSPSTCFAITATKLDGRSKLVKAAKKARAYIEAKPLRGRALPDFVRREAKARNHVMSGAAAAAVADSIGEDLAALCDAVERLSLFAGDGQRIDEDMVATCISRARPDTIWRLVDAIAQKDKRITLQSSGSLLAAREPPLRLLAMVARQLRMIAKMRQALRDGANPQDAARAAGAPPFKAQELARSAKLFNGESLSKAFHRLAEADQTLKGSKRPGELVLQEALLALCETGAPRGSRAARP